MSPDPKLPKAVVGIAKDERLILCLYDYMTLKKYSEIDVGKTQLYILAYRLANNEESALLS